MKPRASRGYALIEMLAVIAITSTIMGIVGVVSHTLLRSERSSRTELVEEMAYLRLSRDFRRDVHNAIKVEEIPEKTDAKTPVGVRLEPSDGPLVEYRTEGNAVIRTATNKNQPASHERYSLTGSGSPGFAKADRDGTTVVSLRFGDGDSRLRTVSARLGRSSRHDTEAAQ